MIYNSEQAVDVIIKRGLNLFITHMCYLSRSCRSLVIEEESFLCGNLMVY